VAVSLLRLTPADAADNPKTSNGLKDSSPQFTEELSVIDCGIGNNIVVVVFGS